MLTHSEYMEKLPMILISSFYLIEVSSTIPVQMELCKILEIYKLSLQHSIKETSFDYMNFLYNISKN